MGRGNDGAPDRVLNLPTNEAWIDPWVMHLRKLGVRFHVGQHGRGARRRSDGRIAAARVRDRRGTAPPRRGRLVRLGDAGRARAQRCGRADVLALDPALKGIDELFVDWMVGIQFYLRRKVDITRGHITFLDSPWALTALTQGQFWAERDFARDYGDGTAVDCLSVDISDWDTPGMLYGKPAKQCTREEIAQGGLGADQGAPQRHGDDVLPDDIVHSWFLDPGIAWDPTARRATATTTPLLVNTVGTWEKRPKAQTKIPNLFLAGDYVQTDIDLATMEGANESGRAAVNALLDASGLEGRAARRCTSSTTRRSSRRSRRSTPQLLQAPASRTRSTSDVSAPSASTRRRRRALRRARRRRSRSRAPGRRVVALDRAQLPVRHDLDAPAVAPAASPSCRRSARSSA